MNTQKAIETFLSQFKSVKTESNTYIPPSKFVCVRTSVDEGKDLTDIERKQHVFKTTKEL